MNSEKSEKIIESIRFLILCEIKRLKETETSQFNEGEMAAYCKILSSMGISDEDISLFAGTKDWLYGKKEITQ